MLSPSLEKLPSADLAPAQVEPGVSPWRDAWHRLRRNHLAVFGGAVLIVLSLLCVAGPWFSPYGYQETDLTNTFSAPSSSHWLGTDQLGRDLLTRLMFGGRISLMVGLVATFVALTIGVVYGAVSGFFGGKLDRVMMRIVDILYALPFTIVVILLMVLFGRSILLVFLGIGVVEWLTMARVVRGQVLALRHRPFVTAAEAAGARPAGIVIRHIIPNIAGVAIAYLLLTVPQVVMVESFLSFLGLGVQEPLTSLGILVKEGADDMDIAPFALALPGGVLIAILVCLTLAGERVRDRFTA